jgi:HSP20 family molecular chaperone IbpA
MQESSESKIYQEEIKSRKNIDSLRKENEQKENLAIKSYANFSSAQQREIDQAIAEKEREHRQIIRKAQDENSRQLNERERINQENLKRVDEANKNKLLQTDASLQKKVKQVQKESEDAISTLSLKTQKEINNLKQSESKDKSIISNKASDPFYSITNLNPKITDNEKEYILKIPVPEHEKDSVIVGADGRNLKISQNRRYQDETRNVDGTLSKSSRSETISQSIKLGDLVNPRKITQTYDGNEIIFKIPKA